PPRIRDGTGRIGGGRSGHADHPDFRDQPRGEPDRRSGESMASRTERTANYLVLFAFAAFSLWPVLTILGSAFGRDDTAAGAGKRGAGGVGLQLENLTNAWQQGRFGQSMLTSIGVSLFVVACATLLSVMSGYAFGTMRFPGQNVLFYLFLLGLMVP